MRLLKLSTSGELNLTKNFDEEDIPPYAILSHTWGADDDEVTFNDLQSGSGKSKAGYDKIRFCGEQAGKDGLQYFWVDTCCIDKPNHTELSEAITSMFRWYGDAIKCYVYLSDVWVGKDDNNQTEPRWKSASQESRESMRRAAPVSINDYHPERTWEAAFRNSRWFTRGWTLQELLAPKSVEFFSRDRVHLGDKNTLKQLIHEITRIPIDALHGTSLSHFGVDERMRWAEKRETKRKEDKAYCLWGIFNVFMLPNYGERENAFIRLQEEIAKSSGSPKIHYTKLDKATKESLSNLGATDPGFDMDRIENSKDPLLKDCYEWILQDPILQEWRVGDASPLLWICGDPGKGKTMLMIALIREFLKETPGEANVVTFFFCQATDSRLDNVSSILRGLIWKLAVARPYTARIFFDSYESNRQLLDGPNAIYALFSILSAMLEGCPRAFLLIDALDECASDSDRRTLLKLITNHSKSFSRAKWLLTSRNYPDIKKLLLTESRMLSLELNEQHISKAVSAFVEQKTTELATKKEYSPDLTKKVKQGLITKADSTFLWVALACKRLMEVYSWDTLSTLETLPPGLDELYMRMMELVVQREDRKAKEFFFKILRLTSLAFRPISKEELVALGELPKELTNGNSFSELIDLCGSFIIVRNGFLYFVHQSAKDYLVSNGAQVVFPAGLQKEHSLIVGRSLDIMSETLKRDMCNLGHPGSQASTAIIAPRLEAISYSCCFWVDHLIKYLGDNPDGVHYEKYLSNRGQVYEFLLKHLLHWFEALSLIGEVDRGIMGLHGLERIIREIPTNSTSEVIFSTKGFVHDAIRVFRQSRLAVKECPLQLYSSALIFSPENSLVRQHFKEEMPKWISTFPRMPKDWTPSQQTLEGHTDSVWSVAYPRSGQQLASGSSDRTVRLWDVATGACLETLKGHTDGILSIEFSPNGQQLASGSEDHAVRLWDVATWTCLQMLKGHRDWVYLVTFSPSGQQLASGSADNTVRLWDAVTGACLQSLKGHTDSVWSVAYSPSGQQLASCSLDYTVRLWDVATGGCLQLLNGHNDSIYSVAFSLSGQQLASGSRDCTVRLWDIVSGACLQTLEGHTGYVFSVAYSPSGQQLASGASDSTVRLWDAATGACLQTLRGHTGWIRSVVYSPSGWQLASGADDKTVRLWDTKMGTSQQTLESHTDIIWLVAFSPSGRQLASSSGDQTVRLWDTATGSCLQTLKGDTRSVYSVAFSPSGQQLASGSPARTVQLWDTATGARLQTLKGHTGLVCSVAYSPSGQQLASCSLDYTVRLWDVATGGCLQLLNGHNDSIYSVAFSPSGRQLASSSEDQTVRLWDTATGSCLQTLEGHTGSIMSVVYSSNSQQLASGSADCTVRLWDTVTGVCLQTLEGHMKSVYSVAFSPSGRQLASGSLDQTVRLWDVATGGYQQTLEGYTDSVAFSPDGCPIVTDFEAWDEKHPLQVDQSPKRIGWGIESEKRWVTWNGRNMLWLPPEYRPKTIAVKDSCIAVGSGSGVVYFLKFCANSLPY